MGERKAVRPIFLVALAALIVPLGVGGLVLWRRDRARQIEDDRIARTTALVEVAPAPLPTGLPIVGSTTPGPDGYAPAHVDKPALRSLLWHRKFADLTRDFEQLEDAFEADPRKEYWPADAGDAFASAEPSLAPKLDAWVAATPDSFAPYFARGTYEFAVAEAKRGMHWAKDTPAEDFKAMEAPLRAAERDLAKALALRPNLVAAMRWLIGAAAHESDQAEKRKLVDRATTFCAECFQIRVAYLSDLRPRWGGSYTEMRVFAASAPVAKNARLRLLAGYPDLDRAELFAGANDYGGASKAIEDALAYGEGTDFLVERARIRQGRKDWGAALADLDRANELRPQTPEILVLRANALTTQRRSYDAGVDLLDAVRITTTEPFAREVFPVVVNNLQYDGWQAHKAGHRDEALRFFDLAADLAPTDSALLHRRAWIILGTKDPDIPALQAAAAKSPDDLRLHQQLDYALSQKNRYAEIAAMWTEYIARHPDDATAYRERAGTYYHLGDSAKSRADAAEACELGDSEGCAHAR